MDQTIHASVCREISGSERARRLRAALLACTFIVAVPAIGLADPLPTGGNVVSGSASISQPGSNSMLINQGTNRAIINWDTFNIGANASVDIRQPNSNSAILNRVTGNIGTEIHGRLTANGQVHIVNPNGIVIGKDGKVETGGGFVATTLDIADGDFMDGRLSYGGNGGSAGVTNRGTITVGRGGYAALLGGRVDNSGTIVAPLGRIGLGAGERTVLDLSGDQFLQVTLPSADDGDDSALVKNAGRLSADGGRIEMKAATARDAARRAINLSGVAEARSVSVRNGVIVLGGGDGGSVRVSGKVSTRSAPRISGLTSSARPPQPTGGQIDITGARIALEGALLDASGDGGGGRIRIGGDFGGEGPLPHAATLMVDAGTQILADALLNGDGGRIVLWSDDYTGFAGRISARGGTEGGNGGFVEVSSHADLRYDGLTDLRAPQGKQGKLLLDPEDITIPGTMTEATLESQLALGDVELDTSDCVECSDVGDITILADIDWDTASILSLLADNDIIISGDITAANGGLILSAANGIDVTGAIAIDRFHLSSGDWVQIATILPAFSANDFTTEIFGASFLRAIGGTGTEADPYVLTDVYGLQGMASANYLDSHFALGNDIDASGTANWGLFGEFASLVGFDPIGNGEVDFSGSLDGRGHAISGLFVDNFTAGLFGYTDGAGIRNLRLTDIDITGEDSAGGIVANAWDTQISNVSAAGFVGLDGSTFDTRRLGGLVGWMSGGSIRDSRFDGTVTDMGGMDSVSGPFYQAEIGGIVGHAEGAELTGVSSSGTVLALGEGLTVAGGVAGQLLATTLSDSSSSANLRADLIGDALFIGGGLVGHAVEGLITGSSATGSVASTGADDVATTNWAALGGLIGWNEGSITDSFATGDVYVNYVGGETRDTSMAGGLAGINHGSIERAYATGDVTILTETPTGIGGYIGGFVGINTGAITDAFASGNVFFSQLMDDLSGWTLSVGGFAGMNFGLESTASLTRTAARGAVSAIAGAGAVDIGGHTGTNGNGDIIDSYATGSVTGSSALSQNVGGLVGYTDGGSVTRTYSSGAVQTSGAGQTNAGGLIGFAEFFDDVSFTPTTSVTASFWDPARSGQTPGTRPGYGTPISTATFHDTAAFMALASAQGWDFDQVWAPGDAGWDPAIYTIDRVVLARPEDVTVQYGQTGSASTTGTVNGGPSLYVFAPEGDTLNTAPIFLGLNFPDINVGTGQFTLSTTALTSSAGQDYRVVDLPAGYTITPAPLTVTADDRTKTYGQGVTFSGTEFTTSGLLFDDSVSGVTLDSDGAAASANVGSGSYAITATDATGSGLSNYDITYVDGSLTVNRAALTVTADDRTKTYGQGVTFSGTEFTTSGLLLEDSVSGVTLDSDGAAASANVGSGSYAITATDATGSGLSNYDITYVDGSLTVNRAALTVTADDRTKTYGQGVTFSGTEFTTSGLLLEDSVSGVTLDSDGAAASANVGSGSYAITATDATGSGLSNYDITYVDGSLTVNRAALTVTADDRTKTYGQGVTFNGTEFTTSGLLLEDSVSGVTLDSDGAPASASVDGSPYPIIATDATGSGLDNYDITYVSGALNVLPEGTPPPDNVPRPPLTVIPGLPNPTDTIADSGPNTGSPTLVTTPVPGNVIDQARDTLAAVDEMAAVLEIAAQSCAQSDTDVSRYLACLSDSLDQFADKLDSIATDLPPGMENVAQIVRDARSRVDTARSRAEQRLAGATTASEREAIRRDAINEARDAIATASAEIRKTISLARADDPELARIQAATAERVAQAVDSVNIELSRAIGL